MAAFEKGLRQHIRMKHKESQIEVLRSLEESSGPLEQGWTGEFFFTGQDGTKPKIYGAGRLMVLNLRGEAGNILHPHLKW